MISGRSLDWFDRCLGPTLAHPSPDVWSSLACRRLGSSIEGGGKKRICPIGNYVNQRLLRTWLGPFHWGLMIFASIPFPCATDSISQYHQVWKNFSFAAIVARTKLSLQTLPNKDSTHYSISTFWRINRDYLDEKRIKLQVLQPTQGKERSLPKEAFEIYRNFCGILNLTFSFKNQNQSVIFQFHCQLH